MTDDNNDDDREPYNGAAYGYSPYDMDARECRYWADDEDDDDGDYDCCDDAEDYGDEDDDAEND